MPVGAMPGKGTRSGLHTQQNETAESTISSVHSVEQGSPKFSVQGPYSVFSQDKKKSVF